MAKGKNEAKIKFTAETADFNKAIKNANTEISSLRAELKLNAAEMANTDDKASKLAERQEMLGQQLEYAKAKTEALRQKLEAAKRIYGENSDEANRLEIAVLNAQTAEQNFQNEITKCNAEIIKNNNAMQEQQEAAEHVETAMEKLERTISEQEDTLEQLKREYSEAVLEYGEMSKNATFLKGDINKLNAELNDNREKARNAKEAAEQLTAAMDGQGAESKRVASALDTLENTISEQEGQLEKLKNAYKNAILYYGDTSDEAEDLADEIRKLTNELNDNRGKAKKLDDAVDDLVPVIEEAEEAAEEAADGFTIWGGTMANLFASGISAAISGIGELCSTFWNLGDETREFRTNMGKVEVAFTSAGFSAETATAMYEEFYGVLGDEGKATEAISHLAKVADTEEELADWTTICTGVYAEFGDSLPIEGLAEAANETAKTGQITGGLSDALQWAGISEEEFQKKLDKCNSEAEREALIRETLLGLYGDSADAYMENNESIIEANKAQARYNSALAELGAIIEPIKTKFVNGMAAIIEKVAAFIRGIDFEPLKSAWKYLSVMWKNQLKPALEGLWKALKAVFEAIKPAIQPFLDFFDGLGDGKSPMERFRAALWDIKSAVTWVTDKLNAFSDWAKEHPNTIKVITAAITGLVAGFVAFKAAMSVTNAIKKVGSAIKAAKTGFAAFNAVLAVNPIALIVTAIAALVAAFLYLWNNCEGFREFWINLWNKVKAYVEPIWEAISGFFVQAWEKIKAVWQYVQPYFETIWKNILVGIQFFKDQFVNVFRTAWNLIKIVWDQVVNYFSAIWESIKLVFSAVGDILSGDFSGAWEKIKAVVGVWGEYFAETWENIKAVFAVVVEFFANTFANVWTAIKGVLANWGEFFSGLWDKIKGVFEPIGEWFYNAFLNAKNWVINAWNNIGDFFSGIWNGIVSIFSSVGSWFLMTFHNAKTWVQNAWSSVTGFFSDIWTGIQETFANVKTWLYSKFMTAKTAILNTWSTVTGFFSGIWEDIKGVFGAVGTWFYSKFYSAWTQVKNVFSSWGKFFSDLWDKIKTTFTNLGTKIGDAVGSAVKSGINGMISWVESTLNKAIGLINGAIKIMNKVPGIDIGTLDTVSIPRLASGGVATVPMLAEIGEYAGAKHNPEIVTPQNIMRDTFEDVLNARIENNLSLDRLVDAINELADRPINIAVNDRILAEATAGAYDTVSGNRLNLRERGLAL